MSFILFIFICVLSFKSASCQNFDKETQRTPNTSYSSVTTTVAAEVDFIKNFKTFVPTNADRYVTEVPHSKLAAQEFSSHLYSSGKINECWKEAKCEPLEERMCLGVKLPYTHTSLALSGLPSQRAAREALEYMTALKNLPHCWSVVQPLLCAILFPQCNGSSVQLPSMETCTTTRVPCRLFEKENGWPDYLTCKKEYPSKCKTLSRELDFNTTGQCSPPLINTTNENLWVDGIRSCAVQCADPMLTEEERKDLQNFIAVLGGVCLACSALAVLTFAIDWRHARKYPSRIIFHINLCFLVASTGFMVQFFGNTRKTITCNPDGTQIDVSQSYEKYISCIVVFFCVYYFMIAAGVWFSILGIALHRSYNSFAADQCQQDLKSKSKCFQLLAWSIPSIFALFIFSFRKIKADSAVGICFLSPTVEVRVLALLAPISISIIIGLVYLIKGLITLAKMKLECSNIISEHANKKIIETIIRLGIFIVAIFLLLCITIFCHYYIFKNEAEWNKALRNFILCSSKIVSDNKECIMSSRPSVISYKWHLGAFFGSGILMALLCCTSNSVKAWQRCLRRVIDVDRDEPIRLRKHQVIAQAFAKRNELNNAGRLSISLRSWHSDPLGLNFEMNSATSCDVSSVFAAAIPYFMNRRGAVCGSSAFVFRRNSFDSEYSISRRVSLESTLYGRRRHYHRRHSLDSQMSLHVSDIERVAAMQTIARFGQNRKRRDMFLSLRKGKKTSYDRRNSTSDDSNMSSMILPTLTLSTNDSLFTTMMKKLNLSSEDQSFTRLKKDERQNFHITTDSEDDARETTNTALPFARKYNGFKHKGVSYNHAAKGPNLTSISKASVGVQTSLDSLVMCQPLTHDKFCQVSTPLLQRIAVHENTSVSSTSDSFTSLSESNNVKETCFMSSEKKVSENASKISPLPLSRSLKKTKNCYNDSAKYHKKRCFSENDKSHRVLDIEDVSND